MSICITGKCYFCPEPANYIMHNGEHAGMVACSECLSKHWEHASVMSLPADTFDAIFNGITSTCIEFETDAYDDENDCHHVLKVGSTTFTRATYHKSNKTAETK